MIKFHVLESTEKKCFFNQCFQVIVNIKFKLTKFKIAISFQNKPLKFKTKLSFNYKTSIS